MPSYGRITEYTNGQNWEEYVEQVKNYFGANEITDAAKKRMIFLTSVGSETFHLMKTLVAPAQLDTKTFEELATLVQNHRNPKPSVIVSRFNFNTRSRKSGESIADYIVHLRQLAGNCDFGDTLSSMLRDRLVCGVNDEKIQLRLLAEEDTMTFKNAMDIAISMESASRYAKDMEGVTADTLSINAAKTTDSPVPRGKCFSCGGNHRRSICKFREAECYICHRKGHISKVCGSTSNASSPTSKRFPSSKATSQSSNMPTQQTAHHVETAAAPDPDTISTVAYDVFTLGSVTSRNNPIRVDVVINGVKLDMEVDSGAAVSIIDENTYAKHFDRCPLTSTNIRLRSYTGEIPVMGKIDVEVRYLEQSCLLPLVVVKGTGPSLFGRDWMSAIRLDWPNLLCVKKVVSVDMLQEFPELFTEGLGKFNGPPVEIHVNENAKSVFCRARSVPYALRSKIEDAIDRNVREGIWQPVQYSDWAAPLVPVQKSDGTIRLCGDYKVTCNRVCEVDKYPIPKVSDVFSKLAGGKTFSKIDLSQAYSQIPVHETSQKYLTVNTHKGLYQVTRLPFGVSSAPGMFQRLMDCLVGDITGVVCYLDDILITGLDSASHASSLRKVLERLRNAGLKVKAEKCELMLPSIVYLGHRLDAEGIHPTEEKVRALQEAPVPTNVAELRAFLGLINYYAKFVPNLSSTLSPLYKLTQKNQKWRWGEVEQETIEKVKNALSTDTVLVHFDDSLPVLLECDASPTGVGAVLSHRFPDGTERPVAYASRGLLPAEKNYSQIDREGLAVVFGVKKFHQFLYGRTFTLVTDHKPLTTLFASDRQIPQMASARIQRWALTLAAYQYEIQYKKGVLHSNADALSRLPLPCKTEEVPQPAELVHALSVLEECALTSNHIRSLQQRDPILSRVYQWVMQGWSMEQCRNPPFKPYYARKEELSAMDGILTWGARVVIPTAARPDVLKLLHDTHLGISRMKALARSYVWWPCIDSDIDSEVQSCVQCQSNRNVPAEAPLHPWEWPTKPWSRVHIDHAGPFHNAYFLVLVDSHSKWIEVEKVPNTSSAPTLRALQKIFTTHGLPDSIVSDNGTAFTSEEFRSFCKRHGIRHIRSAPRHPATNGLAERAVQTFKSCVRKMDETIPIEFRVLKFLARYRITPQSTTGRSPAELLLRRVPKTHLDLLRGNVESRVWERQHQQGKDHDVSVSFRAFAPGDKVFTHSTPPGNSRVIWIPGVVHRVTGPLSYEIDLRDRGIVKRHIDQIRKRTCVSVTSPHFSPKLDEIVSSSIPEIPTAPISDPPAVPATEVTSEPHVPAVPGEQAPLQASAPNATLRRSMRVPKKPDRLIEH